MEVELGNSLLFSFTMPLEPGVRLGPYEIVGPVGAQPNLDIVVNWFADVRRKVQEAKGK